MMNPRLPSRPSLRFPSPRASSVACPCRRRGRWLRLPSFALGLALLVASVPRAARQDGDVDPNAGAEAARQRPNIVVILSDDQSFGSLGVAGHPWLQTPNMDRLAAEGVWFRNAFVTTSLCSPSRATFLTGQYARAHGIVENKTKLEDDAVTFASLLTAAGYDTGFFGKWHLGDYRREQIPGFRHSASFPGQGRYFDPVFQVDGERVPKRGHADDLIADFAADFVQKEREEPFLAFVSFKGPHGPLTPAERFNELYTEDELPAPVNLASLPPYPLRLEWLELARKAEVPFEDFEPPPNWADGRERYVYEYESGTFMLESLRDYFRLITGVDENVGKILAALDEAGLAEDTFVFYASDNGHHLGEHGLGSKGTAYEESMRTVMLLRYPRLGLKGARSDELVLNVDLAPTILDYAGVAIPATMRGRSWRSILEGEDGPLREDFLYEYYRHPKIAIPSSIAVRTRTDKLVLYPGHPEWTELFDLARDPHEMTNLVDDPGHAERLEALRKRLAELEKELGPRPQQ